MIHHHIRYAALLALLATAMPCTALIYGYILMVNEKSGQNIHLFLDYHRDVEGLKNTLQQADDLFNFVKALENPKEVIVEDADSLLALLTGEAQYKPILPEESDLPEGNPNLVEVTSMDLITLSYSLANIPVFNVEFRKKHWPWERVIENIVKYNDGPILNDYYAPIKKRVLPFKIDSEEFFERVQANKNDLLDMRILHRIYLQQNRLRNAVIIAGGDHIIRITPILEQLGYTIKTIKVTAQQLSFKNVKSADEYFDYVYDSGIFSARSISKQFEESSLQKEKVGKVYQDTFDKLALDISKLPRPETKPQPKPAGKPRSKL